jgi:hypothetical protein
MDDTKPVTWKPILDDMDKRNVCSNHQVQEWQKFSPNPKDGVSVFFLRMLRGPWARISGRRTDSSSISPLLEDQHDCGNPVTERFLEGLTPERCLVPRRNETYLI